MNKEIKETAVLTCRGLSKSFKDANQPLIVLDNIDFEIEANQTIAIVGASGSGKSTFLHLLGGLDFPSSGKVLWKGESIHKMSESKKSKLRNQYLGFIYQFHHLLPEFTALENVAMPLLIGGDSASNAQRCANDFLAKVGLQNRKHHKIGELSGGERQRTAIARALITQPACVLADEPTGNLDAETAESVLNVMLDLQQELGTSFIVVTHDQSLANRMGKRYTLKETQLFSENME